VPTPLNKNQRTGHSFISTPAKPFEPYLKGMLGGAGSTTYPGTTDEDLARSARSRRSKLKAGTDFNLAFSPEREGPGNAPEQG